ncbi:MAG TPA: DUF1353 domain-containing protein [Acidimicrobiia bacterium]|nr:DUF1353 domain-containing protein [Acidimicrobiia bacterium]
MFRTPLEVRHNAGDDWELTAPLVFEGNDELFVMRSGFRTDFASIPRPFRWLFDSAGHNAEAGVLHDAAWRESKRTEHPRIDPWDADGLFRRALRLNGATAAARGLMWVAVRVVAIASRRFGRNGPSLGWKLVQVIGMLLVGIGLLGAPTAAVLVGLVVFWIGSWIIAPVWVLFERRRGDPTNWPWPARRGSTTRLTAPPSREVFVLVDKDSVEGTALRAALAGPTPLTEAVLDRIFGTTPIDLMPSDPVPAPTDA